MLRIVSVLVFLSNPELTLVRGAMINPELCECLPQKASGFNQFIPVQNKNDYLYFNSNSSDLDVFSTNISTVKCTVGLHFSSVLFLRVALSVAS